MALLAVADLLLATEAAAWHSRRRRYGLARGPSRTRRAAWHLRALGWNARTQHPSSAPVPTAMASPASAGAAASNLEAGQFYGRVASRRSAAGLALSEGRPRPGRPRPAPGPHAAGFY